MEKLTRSQKIELLKEIANGRKSVDALCVTPNLEIWEDVENVPGKFREAISGRTCNFNQLKNEASKNDSAIVKIYWCNVDPSQLMGD